MENSERYHICGSSDCEKWLLKNGIDNDSATIQCEAIRRCSDEPKHSIHIKGDLVGKKPSSHKPHDEFIFKQGSRVGEISVKDLLEDAQCLFYIPSYQRGYRWQSKQVEALLGDFRTQWKNGSGGCYLLQPIVIKKYHGGYLLVDGQQRMTTLKIIMEELSTIHGNDFSSKFGIWGIESLDSWDLEIEKLSNACRRNCRAIVRDEKNQDVLKLLWNHLDDIRFIYYVLGEEGDEGEHEAFERLNAGKIGLTDAELIRALLIIEKRGRGSDTDIASEWEQIENCLQQEEFWYMFNRTPPPSSCRIDRIFRIVAGTETSKINGETFWRFEEMLKEKNDNCNSVEEIWNEVLNVFWMLTQCYEDITIYHYIGWFTYMTDVQFRGLYNLYQNDRFNFRKNLQRSILGQALCPGVKIKRPNKNHIYLINSANGYDFRDEKAELRYLHPYAKSDGFPLCFIGEDKKQFPDIKMKHSELRELLLIFNLESMNQTGGNISRFPFVKLLSQKWEIEHVSAHKNDSGEMCEDEIDSSETEDSDIEMVDKNKISNLALLDKKTNATYGCKPFLEKRKYIFGVDGQHSLGVYVPTCTKDVFAKAYSKELRPIDRWDRGDADDYQKRMIDVFKKMWVAAGL